MILLRGEKKSSNFCPLAFTCVFFCHEFHTSLFYPLISCFILFYPVYPVLAWFILVYPGLSWFICFHSLMLFLCYPACRHEPNLLAAQFCACRGECLLWSLSLPGGGQGQDSGHQAGLHGQHPGGDTVRQALNLAQLFR